MRRRQPETFLAALAALRSRLPLPLPARVRRVRLADGDAGDCVLRGRRFEIRVDCSLCPTGQRLVLAHEWAHARAWRLEGEDQESHDAHWGIETAKAYRVVCGELHGTA